MNKDKFFIGIGPSKTASTWLYHTLSSHPESKMPPIKELRYFFFIDKNIKATGLSANVFGKNRTFQHTRQWSKTVLKRAISQLLRMKYVGIENLYWVFQYFCMPPNDKWYKKMFSNNKLSGDISPQYSKLSEISIQRIKNINPKTKIIIGLRNPIDRSWSFAKMKYLKQEGRKNISEVDKTRKLHFFNHISTFNDYIRLIKKWQKHFPKEQILIYYFDELQENPQKLFNKICEFLEIQPVEIDGIDKKVNKGIVEEIPTEYEQELIRLNYKYIEEFAQAYPNKYSLAWLEKYKNKL